MEILFLLLPVSVLLMGLAMWLFVRAVDNGQFDNLNRHVLDIFDIHEDQENEGNQE